MPRETTESRQNSSRYGSSALLSGTVGCTSQSMAPTSVITSVMSLGFDVGGKGDFLPARDLPGHPSRQFSRRVAIDVDAEIFVRSRNSTPVMTARMSAESFSRTGDGVPP